MMGVLPSSSYQKGRIMKLVSHAVTMSGTKDEWEKIAEKVGDRRLATAIRRKMATHVWKARYYDYHNGGFVDNTDYAYALRFRGGSVARITDAIIALDAEARA
jgi:hypothetical protein